MMCFLFTKATVDYLWEDIVNGLSVGCLLSSRFGQWSVHLTLHLCCWTTSREQRQWAEGRKAWFGYKLHTSSGVFAGWAALPWQAQKNKLGQMVTWRIREEHERTWKIKYFTSVFSSLRLMPVWIFLLVKTGCIGNHLQHMLRERGSVTWQFHAWMGYFGFLREREDTEATSTAEQKRLSVCVVETDDIKGTLLKVN